MAHSNAENGTGRLNRGCNLVLQALAELKNLSTAQEIHAQLRGDFAELAPGLTTVYRAVETLLKLNLVQTVDLGDGEKRFEKVEQGEHHHHLICTRCRASIHLDQCMIDDIRHKIEEHHGYSIRTHILEIFGICPRCAQSDESTLKA